MDYKENDSNIDDEFLQDFIIETQEHLEAIEMNILDVETESDEEQIVNSLFRSFHTIKGLAGFVDQGLIEKISHKTETVLDFFRKDSLKISKDIANLILDSADLIGEICGDISLVSNEEFRKGVLEFLEQLESYEKYIQSGDYSKAVDSANSEDDFENKKRIGEILLEDRAINEKDLEEILNSQNNDPDLKFGQIAVKEKKAKARDIINGIRKQKQSKSHENNGGIIRIPTKKIDDLVDMMGELIITQSQIEQEAETKYDSNDIFFTKLLNMSRIMKEMQGLSMSLRMVSLKSTFQKLTRIARDTIDEMGKDVDFILDGEDTEIDRNIAEKLLEPLVHLVKNSISHGIESRDLRQKRGKTPTGHVSISAYSNKGSVYIEICDDGNGIDLDVVYKKALEKELISETKNYSEKEIQDFIFLPGFSTIKDVNKISGRGVGMDVVKTGLSKIGGKIETINNPGKGCKFVLKIPINLAVMNGTIISIMDNKYIIPTLSIKQIIQVEEDNWVEIKGKKSMIRLRDSVIPLINISKMLNIQPVNDNKLAIILEMDNEMKAIPVDDIIGRREIVVKPMNEEFSDLDYISGASILGDGTVSLILDIEYLFKQKGA